MLARLQSSTSLVLYGKFKRSQLCANQFSTQENTEDDGCIQQTTTMLVTTNDCFVDNFSAVKLFTVCMHRQKMLRKVVSILVSKENCIKKQLFSKRQRKTRKKRQYWFRNCHTDNWWVDIMLAVAPVEDLWKKKMSDSPG